MSPRYRWTVLATLLLAGVTTACPTPQRIPLPAPFPVTGGGTPVPGNGLGLALELGDGLQGQELLRKELIAGTLMIGVGDRASLWISAYGGHEDRDPGGFLLRGKAHLGGPFGARTSSALALGVAGIGREDGNEQSEELRSLDFALPTELLLGDPAGAETRVSLYAGPRLVYDQYRDELVPEDNFEGLIPGLLGGIHVGKGGFHVFGEATVAHRPATTYRGVSYDGGLIFLPSVGVAAHLGDPFRWGG